MRTIKAYFTNRCATSIAVLVPKVVVESSRLKFHLVPLNAAARDRIVVGLVFAHDVGN